MAVWVTLAQGALWGVACDKVPLLAPSGSEITLSSNTSIVQSNGVAEIRATVLESSGTPVQNGTLVTFTTNLGTLSPPEARTVNGTATVQFVGNGQSGEAEISAVSGGAKPDSTLKLKVGAAAAGRIGLSANPSRLPNTGGSSQITATVSDSSGNSLSSVPVTFTTTAGSLSSSVATTGLSGQATVTLTTSREAKVTAAVGGSGTGAVTPAEITVTLGVTPGISFGTTTPASPVEDQPVTFTLNITPGATSDPFQNVVINFGDGTGDQSLGPVNANTSVSHTFNRSGTFTVTATGTTANGDTSRAVTIITVSDRAPIGVEVSPTTTTAGTSTTYTVTLTPSTTSVRRIDWDFGDGTPDQSTTGRSTSHVYTLPGTYVLEVSVTSADGNSGTGEFQIKVN